MQESLSRATLAGPTTAASPIPLAQECRSPHKNMVGILNSCAKPPQQDGLLEFDRFPEFIEERHRILGTKLRELLASA